MIERIAAPVASVSHVIAATLRKCPENNENKLQHVATWRDPPENLTR